MTNTMKTVDIARQYLESRIKYEEIKNTNNQREIMYWKDSANTLKFMLWHYCNVPHYVFEDVEEIIAHRVWVENTPQSIKYDIINEYFENESED